MGAPKIDVMAVIGRSRGATMFRAIMSEVTASVDPASPDNGMMNRLSTVFAVSLAMCGAASPMNPTGPAITVAAATTDEEAATAKTRAPRIQTPIDEAISSPNVNAFNGFAARKAAASPASINGKTGSTIDFFAAEKLPNVQKLNALMVSMSDMVMMRVVTPALR